MPYYATACTLQIPVANDEPREVGAIATIDTERVDTTCIHWVTLEADGSDMLDMPTSYPVYLKSYVAIVPTPGPTQTELDADLRVALGERGWTVL